MMKPRTVAPELGAPVPRYIAPMLVVDDDPARATTTLGWLSAEGYSTVAGSDGVAGLRPGQDDVRPATGHPKLHAAGVQQGRQAGRELGGRRHDARPDPLGGACRADPFSAGPCPGWRPRGCGG